MIGGSRPCLRIGRNLNTLITTNTNADRRTDSRDIDAERAFARQRLRAELDIGSLRRTNAARRVSEMSDDEIASARERADPEGLLTDDDVSDVLAREGVDR